MIKLYLARHGETAGNVQQWYQGSTDVPSMNMDWNRRNAWENFSAMSISTRLQQHAPARPGRRPNV